MKKLLFALTLLVSMIGYGQTYTIEDRAVTGVFEVTGKSKAEIFSAINKWISINYNSGKSVTQLSDSEAGNIVVKGINEAYYKNTYKQLYPNNSGVPALNLIKLNHLIEINVKDNKFRIIYKITDYASAIAPNPYSLEREAFDCFNFNGSSEASLAAYSARIDSLLKMGFIGKTKRELVLAETKPAFAESASLLIADIKLTMQSINKSITTPTTEGW